MYHKFRTIPRAVSLWLIVGLVLVTFAAALPVSAAGIVQLHLSFAGLENLGSGWAYEGWLIVDGAPVSTGVFTIDDSSSPSATIFAVQASDASKATAFVLTIEPSPDTDPAPSAVHVLGGDMLDGTADLSTDHAAALGDDFGGASGSYILSAPSGGGSAPYENGIWWLDPSAGPGPSLNLPALPEGWMYEGWVVGAEGPISTGRFLTPDGADSDGAGPDAGPDPAPPFPGQDFVDLARDLTDGYAAVISIEPEPDNSADPFAFKPLLDMDIEDVGAGVLQAMSNNASALPSGTATVIPKGKIVVANRASGTISVISTYTDQILGTFDLPSGDNAPEPMYVVYSPAGHRVFVGDRANDRIVVFDALDYSVEATVEAGAGVFHMWADPQGRQLWVNNDIDATTTVISPRTLQVLATVPTPADLVAQGGVPHDVILSHTGRFAYISVVGVPGDYDYVVQFDTRTLQEIGRAAVGKDPHLSPTERNRLLYVPSQVGNTVHVLDRRTLAPVTEIPVPGAHGAGMSRNGRFFYTTNLPGGGADGLYTINTRTNRIIGQPTDTPYEVPHNIALTPNGGKLYVTHSGPTADKVTIYTTERYDPAPVYAGEVSVGLNPFGLAYVP